VRERVRVVVKDVIGAIPDRGGSSGGCGGRERRGKGRRLRGQLFSCSSSLSNRPPLLFEPSRDSPPCIIADEGPAWATSCVLRFRVGAEGRRTGEGGVRRTAGGVNRD
jgi:hypothetical protein